MGCNTSKESVQPAAEQDDKESKNDVKNETGKSASGESTAEAGSPGKESRSAATPTRAEEGPEQTAVNEEEAATRIQAAFRGHHARKSMKETENSTQPKGTNPEEAEPTEEQLREEFRADDKELCNAATKIQASFRGHLSRKEQAGPSVGQAAGQLVDDTVAKIEEKMDEALNELDGIDLTDPDLHKAATKIQASFRGHKVRQEVVPEVKK